MGPQNAVKRQRARELRTAMTPAEALLWQNLRTGKLDNIHFRRQQPIDGFIADFYCHSAALIIELDGPIHADQSDYDAQRDRILAARRLRILRFSNERVLKELSAVLKEIRTACAERPNP